MVSINIYKMAKSASAQDEANKAARGFSALIAQEISSFFGHIINSLLTKLVW